MAVSQRRMPPKASSRLVLTRNGGKNEGVNRYKAAPKVKKEMNISALPLEGAKSLLTWLGIMVGGLLIFAGAGFGLLQGYKYFTSGEFFRLKTIDTWGLNRLDSREILEMTGLGGDVYVNTLALSIDKIEEIVSCNPWVAELSVKRVLPDKLVISVKERDPGFWVQQDGEMLYADAVGRLIAPVSSKNFVSLPLLEVEPGAEIYCGRLPEIMAGLAKSAPPVGMEKISWVRLEASGSLQFRLTSNNLLLSIGLEDWQGNLQRLGRVLQDLALRGELREAGVVRADGHTVLVEKKG